MLAEAILRGKGQRRKRGEARSPSSLARAARTAEGTATTTASPPRGCSSAELVPLRRVQEKEENGEEEGKQGAEKQRAKAAPPMLPASPFVGVGRAPSPPPSSSPPLPLSLPPRFHVATNRDDDCVSIDMEPEEATEEAEERNERDRGRLLLARSQGSKHFKAVADGLEEEEQEEREAEASPFSSSSSSSSSSSYPKRAVSIVREAMAAAANPPAVAALVGLAVGSVPALRSLFFAVAAPSDDGSSSSPTFAVLGSLSTAFETLGGAMIPSLMVVLGAELSAKQEGGEGEGAAAAEQEEENDSSSSLPAAAVAAALTARLVLMPCLGALFLFLFSRIGLLSPGRTSPSEPLFRLVALLAWGE